MLIYLLTLAPTITWAHDGADGGDLITGAYTLGVPHPPGYPAYCLLGWLFAHLPVGDIAWRFNLMSATGAALAALGLYAAVMEWQREAGYDTPVAGLGAAWGLAFVPVLWSQALIAEVYAINAAFVALTLWLSLRARRMGTAWAATGLAWGLSLGMHLTGLALMPVIIWALVTRRRGRSSPQAFLLWLLGTTLGLSTYVYLPLRAGRGAITWGDPTTLSGWWWLVSGALYRGYAFTLPLEAVPARLLALMRYLASGFGPTGVVLGVIGMRSLMHQRRKFARETGREFARETGGKLLLASGVSWLLYAAYAIGYDTADSYVYLIPTLIIFALWLGEGLARSLSQLHDHLGQRWGLAVWTCLAFIGPLSAVILNYQEMDIHQDTRARDFGREVCASAPARAILLTAQDTHTFTLWYFQHVLEQRPDLAIVDTGLLGYDWYRDGLSRAYPGLVVTGYDIDELSKANSLRPICEVIEEGKHWLRCAEGE